MCVIKNNWAFNRARSQGRRAEWEQEDGSDVGGILWETTFG